MYTLMVCELSASCGKHKNFMCACPLYPMIYKVYLYDLASFSNAARERSTCSVGTQ